MPTRTEKTSEEGDGQELRSFGPLIDDVTVLYVNHMQALFAPFDLVLRLGQITTGGGEVVVKELIRLRLSPPFAKAAAYLLLRSVEAYEREFGVISLGPDASPSTLTAPPSGPPPSAPQE
jgi:hypothetical protein